MINDRVYCLDDNELDEEVAAIYRILIEGAMVVYKPWLRADVCGGRFTPWWICLPNEEALGGQGSGPEVFFALCG
jgi:hypothetical protein